MHTSRKEKIDLLQALSGSCLGFRGATKVILSTVVLKLGKRVEAEEHALNPFHILSRIFNSQRRDGSVKITLIASSVQD